MIAATFVEISYVIPLGWSSVFLLVIAVAVGALLGAWLTAGAVEDEVERRIALGVEARLRARELDR